MARAYGSSAHLLMKRETVYGQAASGDFIRMPFNRCNLGNEQGLIDDPVLGQGQDPLAPLHDVINDEGDIVVPVDPRYLGLWLTGLFGDPDTTDNLDGSWDHVFASGGDALPSYTVEVGMPKVPAFFVHAGVKLNAIALEFTRSGPAAATIDAIAQGETRFGASQGGTPTGLTFSRISQFQGGVTRAGNPVGNLTAGSGRSTHDRSRPAHRFRRAGAAVRTPRHGSGACNGRHDSGAGGRPTIIGSHRATDQGTPGGRASSEWPARPLGRGRA